MRVVNTFFKKRSFCWSRKSTQHGAEIWCETENLKVRDFREAVHVGHQCPHKLKSRTQVKHYHCNKKWALKKSIPQGGVLAQTLFLVFTPWGNTWLTFEQEESDQGNPCKSRTTANPDEDDFRQKEITNGSSTHSFQTPRSKIKPWERWQETSKQHPLEEWKLSQGFQLRGTGRRSRWILEAMHPLHESKISKRAKERLKRPSFMH